jgi:hypothetical protein
MRRSRLRISDADGGARVKNPRGGFLLNLKLPGELGFSQSSGGPVGKAEDFRANAMECDKLADDAWEPETKRTLQEAAKNWRILADQTERWLGVSR